MPVSVSVQTVHPRRLAAVRRQVAPGAIGTAWRPALDKVMNEAYDVIDKWMSVNGRESAGHSWEIYGDPTPNPDDTETTIVHLLK